MALGCLMRVCCAHVGLGNMSSGIFVTSWGSRLRDSQAQWLDLAHKREAQGPTGCLG